jgi:hypothetical protein
MDEIVEEINCLSANSRTIRKYFLNTELGRLFSECEYSLSIRIKRAMFSENCKSMVDVQVLSRNYWLRVPGFGKKSLAELEEWVKDSGGIPERSYDDNILYLGIRRPPPLPPPPVEATFISMEATGICRRDWFAGMALSGMVNLSITETDFDCDFVAEKCYDIAESMINRSLNNF